MPHLHRHSPNCHPEDCGAHDAYVRLGSWTAPGSPYKLLSGSFSPEAKRHYRGYVTGWLNWCDTGRDTLDPYTCDRAQIAVWISDRHQDAPLATRAVMVSAVTSFYGHLLELGVADGVEKNLTRARLAGAPVPTDPQRTGLRGQGPRWFMQAADRLTGRDAHRNRAICYLLLNQHFGHEKLRPGTILLMDVDNGTNEGFRTTWRIKPKNADASAVTAVTISRDAARLLDTYTGRQPDGTFAPDPGQDQRLWNPALGTRPSAGALFTTTANRARGARLARSDSINRIVNSVVLDHEELAPYAAQLSADFIAATPPPLEDAEK
ncbi:hypothetical protein [Streptomyces anulatus]|uniref:hypothetical protein n=1 Tax=Streptomyces anulatus TaxID=1892 RepID=UPI003253382C